MNGPQRLRNAIKAAGYNAGTTIEFGTVTVASPDFRVKLDGAPIEFDADDFVVASRLIDVGLFVGDRVIVTQMEGGQVYVIIDKIGKF